MGGLTTEVAFLSRALRMPRIRQVAPGLAKTARAEGWDPLELLVKVLAEEVTARETHGGENRIRAARFPQTKTLDNVRLRSPAFGVPSPDLASPPARLRPRSPQRDLLGPSRNRKDTPLNRPRGSRQPAAVTESRSLPPPTGLTRLSEAKTRGNLTQELERPARIPLIVIDEVGYIPFDPEAASLFFSLISSRYERKSLIVTSNKNFSASAEIFGDAVAVAAMVDRLVHHAQVIVLKGQSYRLRGKRTEVTH